MVLVVSAHQKERAKLVSTRTLRSWSRRPPPAATLRRPRWPLLVCAASSWAASGDCHLSSVLQLLLRTWDLVEKRFCCGPDALVLCLSALLRRTGRQCPESDWLVDLPSTLEVRDGWDGSHNLRSSLTLSSLMDDANSVPPGCSWNLDAIDAPHLGPRSAMSSGHWPTAFHTCVFPWCNLVPASVDALFLARTPDRQRQGKRTDAHPPPTTFLPLLKRLGCRSVQGLHAGPSCSM